jgi:hypothetical protein
VLDACVFDTIEQVREITETWPPTATRESGYKLCLDGEAYGLT